MHSSFSKAWRSMRYLASVLIAVRCQGRPIQVHPISTRRWTGSAFPNRVLPTARPLVRSMVAKGSARPSSCSRSAASM